MKKIKFLTTIIAVLMVNMLFSVNHVVNTQGMTFVPNSLSIDIGDSVTFVNTSGFHNVNGTTATFPNNPESFINPQGVASGWSYVKVFSIAGIYNYQCDPHLPGMVGSITVNNISNTIYDIVSNSPDHTTLKVAIDACSLDGVLSDPGSLTLFAPTDAAFNLLPSGTVAALLADIPQLTNILMHHVVGSSVMSSMLSNNQVVTTLYGDVTVTINSMGEVFIDNAQVTVADIAADNGVVHVIDAVLLPSATSVNEGIDFSKPEILYSLNMLGKKVKNTDRNQIVFDIYSNGSVVKRFVK